MRQIIFDSQKNISLLDVETVNLITVKLSRNNKNIVRKAFLFSRMSKILLTSSIFSILGVTSPDVCTYLRVIRLFPKCTLQRYLHQALLDFVILILTYMYLECMQ